MIAPCGAVYHLGRGMTYYLDSGLESDLLQDSQATQSLSRAWQHLKAAGQDTFAFIRGVGSCTSLASIVCLVGLICLGVIADSFSLTVLGGGSLWFCCRSVKEGHLSHSWRSLMDIKNAVERDNLYKLLNGPELYFTWPIASIIFKAAVT